MRLQSASPNINYNSQFNYNSNVKYGANPIKMPHISHETLKKAVKPKNLLKAFVLSFMTLTAATCSNTRGGNFIYNEASNKIERFDNKLDINDMEYTTNKYNLYGCFDKDYIKKYGVDKWIEDNKDKLTGSCMFNRDKTKLISHLIEAFSVQPDLDNCKDFIPTHAAPIFKDENGNIKMLQILSPKVHIVDFADYLKNGTEDFVIYLRDFDINEDRFSDNIKKLEGQDYSFVSAAYCVSDIGVDAGLHCSEGYVQEIQKEGVFKGVKPTKITPHTLLHLLMNKHHNCSGTKN